MPPPRKISLIALGANLATGTQGNLNAVKAALAALDGLGKLRNVSGFWQTPAWPAGAGPDFVNACAALEGPGTPEDVLAGLHRIEVAMGRRRDRRWGPRVIDLDLLAQGDAVLPDAATQAGWMKLPPEGQAAAAPDRLILPHPRIQDRAFVLLPLAEIAPDWRHPVLGATVAQMAAALGPDARAGMTRL